jgi:hypothetical protein
MRLIFFVRANKRTLTHIQCASFFWGFLFVGVTASSTDINSGALLDSSACRAIQLRLKIDSTCLLLNEQVSPDELQIAFASSPSFREWCFMISVRYFSLAHVVLANVGPCFLVKPLTIAFRDGVMEYRRLFE